MSRLVADYLKAARASLPVALLLPLMLHVVGHASWAWTVFYWIFAVTGGLIGVVRIRRRREAEIAALDTCGLAPLPTDAPSE